MKYINEECKPFGLCSEEVQEALKSAENVERYCLQGEWKHNDIGWLPSVTYRAQSKQPKPYTLETFPKGVVWVTHDEWWDAMSMVTSKGIHGVQASGMNHIVWKDLMEYKNAETGKYLRDEA